MSTKDMSADSVSVEEMVQNPRYANRRNKEQRARLNEFFLSDKVQAIIKKKPAKYVDTLREMVDNELGMKISNVAIYHRMKVMREKEAEAIANAVVEEEEDKSEPSTDKQSLAELKLENSTEDKSSENKPFTVKVGDLVSKNMAFSDLAQFFARLKISPSIRYEIVVNEINKEV